MFSCFPVAKPVLTPTKNAYEVLLDYRALLIGIISFLNIHHLNTLYYVLLVFVFSYLVKTETLFSMFIGICISFPVIFLFISFAHFSIILFILTSQSSSYMQNT
jgi:hypothetical protein